MPFQPIPFETIFQEEMNILPSIEPLLMPLNEISESFGVTEMPGITRCPVSDAQLALPMGRKSGSSQEEPVALVALAVKSLAWNFSLKSFRHIIGGERPFDLGGLKG
ncbi:hypothetical protein OCU04_007259 [Sclerotinia nivalis]|uniref:Uncharacterized protein n=1 Tax=Sclerotinia nivalis TaxID=352851 RepID=A0A9X0ALI9_9HELO|nr:hypothetical protein OCU04_007259 [Sclerotinia nivalis]